MSRAAPRLPTIEGPAADRRQPDRIRWIVAALVLVLGTAALRAGWEDGAWPVLFAGGLAGLLGCLSVRRAGVSPAVTVLVAAFVPFVGLALAGRISGLTPLESIVGLFPVLLTSPFPAPVTAQLLAPGLVVSWLAGALLGLGLVRGRFLLAPMSAGLILILAAEFLTAGAPGNRLMAAMLVAVLAAYWSTWARGGPREALAGLVPAVGVGALACAVALLPLGTPLQPRDHVKVPISVTDEPNPLPMIGSWTRQPDLEILRRSGDDYPLHLAVLPDYSGYTFESHSRYGPLGVVRQPELPRGRFQQEFTTEVSWRPTTRWVPAPGVPTEVALPNVRVDADTGTLLLPSAPTGAPVTYRVTGLVDAPRLDEVVAADVGRSARYTALPQVPTEFPAYARELTRNSSTYLEQAQVLESALKADRSFSRDAVGGASYARLQQFLFAPRAEGGRVGTSEQFATAFAVLARSIGMPTRVVVGFGPGEPLPEDPGVRIVRGKDALAWPEVYFEDYGWVAFNPTPDHAETVPPRAEAGVPGGAPAATPTRVPPPAVAPPDPAPAGGWGAPVAMIAGVAAVGVPLALFLGRVLRRRRQCAAGAPGAWQLIEDAGRLAGRTPLPALSAPARAASFGTPARRVAEAAEAAIFAPSGEPAASGPRAGGSRHDAGDARWWELARRSEDYLRGEASTGQRLLWWINPVVWRRR